MEHCKYWNNEAEERKKAYWIEDVIDRRLLDHLQSDTNLLRCFEDALTYADKRFGAVRGKVLDLGAGVCWTTAMVSRWPDVEKVYAFDYSEHRIFKIAPLVFEQMNAVQRKIERHCESMSPLPYESETVDLVIFCQAFYMNDRPERAMRDVYRVLKPGGAVMVTCEGIVKPEMWIQKWGRRAAKLWRCSLRDWRRVLTGRLPDISGRYQYFDADYAVFIADAGFRFERQKLTYPVFKDSPVPATNYFGVK